MVTVRGTTPYQDDNIRLSSGDLGLRGNSSNNVFLPRLGYRRLAFQNS